MYQSFFPKTNYINKGPSPEPSNHHCNIQKMGLAQKLQHLYVTFQTKFKLISKINLCKILEIFFLFLKVFFSKEEYFRKFKKYHQIQHNSTKSYKINKIWITSIALFKISLYAKRDDEVEPRRKQWWVMSRYPVEAFDEIDAMVQLLWQLNVVDIQLNLSGVCQAVSLTLSSLAKTK